MKAIITLLAAAATTALTFGAAQAQAPNPPGIKLDHYHCYRVSPVTRFRPLRVRLADQFGVLQPTVVREQFLCAPVEKNGSRSRTRRTILSATR